HPAPPSFPTRRSSDLSFERRGGRIDWPHAAARAEDYPHAEQLAEPYQHIAERIVIVAHDRQVVTITEGSQVQPADEQQRPTPVRSEEHTSELQSLAYL